MGRPNLIGLVTLKEEVKREVSLLLHTHADKKLCEDKMRKWLSASQEEGPHQNMTRLAL